METEFKEGDIVKIWEGLPMFGGTWGRVAEIRPRFSVYGSKNVYYSVDIQYQGRETRVLFVESVLQRYYFC